MYAAPSHITPGESFVVSYFIRNHTDAATYYVRAKVYDVSTGDVLATENLTQASSNGRLFSKTLTAPADPTGYGRSILVVATVYTDSGYTTKSENYEEQEQLFLVKAANTVLGGGGVDLTGFVERLEDTFKTELARLPKPERVEIPEYPFEAVFGALGALQREVNRIPKREDETEDTLTPKLTEIAALIRALPKPPQVGPVIDSIQQLQEAVSALKQTTMATGSTITNEIEKIVGGLSKEVIAQVGVGVQEHMAKQELTIPLEKLFKTPTDKPAETDPRRDLAHLM